MTPNRDRHRTVLGDLLDQAHDAAGMSHYDLGVLVLVGAILRVVESVDKLTRDRSASASTWRRPAPSRDRGERLMTSELRRPIDAARRYSLAGSCTGGDEPRALRPLVNIMKGPHRSHYL
jgi:hypothetical protein